MQYIADFHFHSKYSRATSRQSDLENLERWARIKGIKILGTSDFTHPEWLRELKEKLESAEEGLYRLKSEIRSTKSEINSKFQPPDFKDKDGTRFILTTEISCIYTKKGKVRKIHIVIFAPSFEVVDKINTQLSWSANLKSDGRPIIGMDAKELTKIVLASSPECLLVPAHIWTPWFSLFGSRSGFDSVEECFEELTPHIFAMETGLSSDPAMNWRLSALDKYTLISNSDAHSPQKIGREANIFEGENLSYKAIIEAIKKRRKVAPLSLSSPLKLISTIEFFPEEGKYHFDGHRLCKIRLSPKERKEYGGICPNCGKPMTVGVLSRVEELADREEGAKSPNAVPFKKLVPLPEIISEVFNQGSLDSKIVEGEYQKLINYFGNEFELLLRSPIEEISRISPEVANGIKKIREGELEIVPGYDGEYGKVQISGRPEERQSRQKTLF